MEEKIQNNTKGMKKSRKGAFLLAVVFVVVFYLGAAWGKSNTEKSGSPSSGTSSFVENLTDPVEIFRGMSAEKPEDLDFEIFWEAWKKFDKKYVDEEELNSQERVYGAIRGMIRSIGDPYSGFMDPEETKDFDSDLEGSFEGIGAELGVKEGVLTVIAPIEGMPAEKAGIRSGDKIIRIGDEVTSDMTIDDAVKKIRGEKGTEVSLTILREGEDTTREIKVVRDKIEIKSVIYEKKDDGIAYIKIKKFSEDTSREFDKAVTTAIVDNSKGVLLDMRNNPGGFLSVAVEISSRFISRGEVVVWEQGRDDKKFAYKAEGGNSLSDIPVVVLINEGSASASEIVAGALRDNKRSLLVGKKSFGKGSVQELESLRDGSSLRITIAEWLTPSGKSIHDVGLDPDVEVDLTNDDFENKRDPQYDRAMEEIKKLLN